MLKKVAEEIFILHHLDLGLDEEEVEDILQESSWKQREKWLIKNGYSLDDLEQEG